MKHPLFTAAALCLGLLSAGCAGIARKSSTSNYSRAPRAYALAVTVNGVLQPTPAQWAAIQEKLADFLAQRGAILVTDLSLADKIIRIDFTPNPNSPESSGRIHVIGIRENPRHILASTTNVGRYPTTFGFNGSFQSSLWGHGGYHNDYYGWRDSFYHGYSYGSGNLSPISPPVVARPVPPMRRHHPGDNDDCPTPAERYIRPLSGTFAGNLNTNPPNDHPQAPPSRGRRWSGGDSEPVRGASYASHRAEVYSERSISSSSSPSSDSGSSRASSAGWRSSVSSIFSRAEPSYSRPEPAYSTPSSYSSGSSDSSASYSSSSSSSASSSSSYSAPSSSGSSGEGSAGHTSTAGGVHQH